MENSQTEYIHVHTVQMGGSIYMSLRSHTRVNTEANEIKQIKVFIVYHNVIIIMAIFLYIVRSHDIV